MKILKRNEILYPCLIHGMDGLIKSTQKNLPEIEDASVSHTAIDESGQEVIWDRWPILVVTRHPAERLLLPTPVLQHLRWCFHKVPFHSSPTIKNDLQYYKVEAYDKNTQNPVVVTWRGQILPWSRDDAWHGQTHGNRCLLHHGWAGKVCLPWVWWSWPP